jgi:hypothetical protein
MTARTSAGRPPKTNRRATAGGGAVGVVCVAGALTGACVRAGGDGGWARGCGGGCGRAGGGAVWVVVKNCWSDCEGNAWGGTRGGGDDCARANCLRALEIMLETTPMTKSTTQMSVTSRIERTTCWQVAAG